MAGLDEPVEALLAEARERFDAEMDTAVHPTPGLFVLLDHLRARGAAAGGGDLVAAGLCRAAAGAVTGSLDRFAFLLAAEDVRAGQARPGDLPHGRRAVRRPAGVGAGAGGQPGRAWPRARGRGAFAVGVPHEHSPAEGLHAADLIVPRLDDPALLALLDGQC